MCTCAVWTHAFAAHVWFAFRWVCVLKPSVTASSRPQLGQDLDLKRVCAGRDEGGRGACICTCSSILCAYAPACLFFCGVTELEVDDGTGSCRCLQCCLQQPPLVKTRTLISRNNILLRPQHRYIQAYLRRPKVQTTTWRMGWLVRPQNLSCSCNCYCFDDSLTFLQHPPGGFVDGYPLFPSFLRYLFNDSLMAL